MNIGLFSDSYYPLINGVTTSISTLAKELEVLGHTVYIFAPDAPQLDSEHSHNVFRMASMPCLFLKGGRLGLAYPPHVLAKIASLNLDIVHTQTEFSLGIVGKFLARTLNIPMVHTYHTMYEDYVHYIAKGAIITPSMAKDFSRRFCNHANAVIAPTPKVKGILEEYGVTKNISVIPTGINISHFRKSTYSPEEVAQLKESLGLSQDTPVVLSLGRVAKEKSIDVIIKGFPKVLETLPNAVLVIVGDGPVRGDLEQLVSTLEITNNVIFTGSKPYSEIGKYYQLGDIFVSASITETQGLTFAEAMAAGLPVVAKNDPSIVGIVNNEQTGILFDEDSEVADKILELLTDTEKCASIAKTAMDLIESMSSEAFGKAVETLYKDIVQDNTKYGFHKHAKLALPTLMPKKNLKIKTPQNKNLVSGFVLNFNKPKYLLDSITKKTMQIQSFIMRDKNNKQ